MTRAHRTTAACHVCGKTFPVSDLRGFSAVRPALAEEIELTHPGWGPGSYICIADLRQVRARHIEKMLVEERGALSALDREVIASFAQGEMITKITDLPEGPDRFGARAADAVARFGGSWTFILIFTGCLILWMSLNVSALLFRPFDPYPFILLNLVLSSVAALQAPVIMMSQRRQETKDRQRSENDYRVNLKAELEIRQLHEKLDHQMAHQWEKLAELQQMQIDMLEDLVKVRSPRGI